MDYGFETEEIEDLLTERFGHTVPQDVIKAIATAVAVNNAQLATDIQKKIDSVLDGLVR